MGRGHRGAREGSECLPDIRGCQDRNPGGDDIRLQHILNRSKPGTAGTGRIDLVSGTVDFCKLRIGNATLMVAAAGQPCSELVTILITDVRCRKAVIIGNHRFTLRIGIGENISTGTGQPQVLALLDPAVISAVANHDLAIERRFPGPGITLSL